MAPRRPHLLAVLSLLSIHLLTCRAESPPPYRTTQGFTINARLYNVTQNADVLAGGLELSRTGTTWGNVCDKQLSTGVARVVCRMFNYTHGEGIGRSRFGNSSGLRFPTKFDCSGSETSLSSCGAASSSLNCTNSSGIVCFNNISNVFDMQIVDGEKSPYQIKGRLEVRLKPLFDWGSVCDDGFTSKSASTACKFLGYKYGEPVERTAWDNVYATNGVYGSSNQTLMDEVTCQGNEDHFLSCPHNIWADHDCSFIEDVGVMCMKTTVKLLSAVSTDFHIGSVEFYNTEESGWFEVCDNGWDDKDAQVVCREIGFQDGRALLKNTLGSVYYGSLTALGSVTNVSCTGSEPDLASCKMNETDLCPFEGLVINLAAVICYDHTVTDAELKDEVRINSSSTTPNDVGYLEIRHMGIWGRVCEDTSIFKGAVTDKEANVACRMKGYAGGKRLGRWNINDGQHHIWLRGFTCNGTENSISECNVPAWGSPGTITCLAPVRVVCYYQEYTLSLQGGTNSTGVLHLKHDNSEMEFCADNWKDSEANMACIELGFNGGRTWFKQGGSTISTSTVMSGLNCLPSDPTFNTCIKTKWTIPREQCLNGPAGVNCFNTVKIAPGYGDSGILQIYNTTTKLWNTICRNGFDVTAATVACKELGYTYGALLPVEVFGFVNIYSRRTNISCTGSETSILNCPFSSNTSGCSVSDYVSISCFNTLSSGTYKLENGQASVSEAYGVLKIFQNSTWGYACDDVFTDLDAKALCYKVGKVLNTPFSDGLKFTSVREIPGPYFMSYANCTTDVNEQYVCNSRSYICYVKRAIYLICAKDSAPKLQLDESDPTKLYSGPLKISVNGEIGGICATGWTNTEAIVACKQINPDYVGGTAMQYNRSTSSFFLSGAKCTGSETSLFQCANNGWKKINTTVCGANSMEAGVSCYKKVFLKDQSVIRDSISGRLSIFKARVVRDVCFDSYFTFTLAKMACQEIGYDNAALLKPSTPDLTSPYSMLKRMTCSATETSLSNCNYNFGSCNDGQVRLLCYKTKMNGVTNWSIKGYDNNIGQLRMDMYDKFVGVVCPVNFMDRDANTVCANRGQFNGVVLGSPQFPENEKEPVWFGNVTCTASSLGLATVCFFDNNVSTECFSKNYSAGVICFQRQEDFGIRLMINDRETRMSGRVEITVNGNGTWGTVCSKNNNSLQARAVCRQKGFGDGVVISTKPKQFGTATGPIYLKDVKCTNSDSLLLGCTNAGWNQVSNCTHDDDLEIACYSNEKFYPDPESNVGAVSIMSNGDYTLICSEGFSDTEATVFCRALGYQKGISICCSALQIPPKTIGVSRVQCQGNENSLLACNLVNTGSISYCYSQQFASAACSYDTVNDYRLSFENYDSGRLLINYYNVMGTVCADEFDQRDAQVACRAVGFNFGLAFFSRTLPSTYRMSWASQLQCNGSERSLDQCANFTLGHTTYCDYVASVFCFRSSANSDINVRIVNGTTTYIGRLEVQINGTWGSVCQEKMADSYAADIVCKELGYRGGMFLPPGVNGPSSGPVWLQGISCNGNETRIKECRLERESGVEGSACATHMYDAAIECFGNVELVNRPSDGNVSGQLKVFDKVAEEWKFVCDSGVTDIEAAVICRTLGQPYGMQQCCNAIGPLNYYHYGLDFIKSISCPPTASDINSCTLMPGNCSSEFYSTVHCSQTPFINENLVMNTMNEFAGQPSVKRFGVTGVICDDGLNDTEARVMCREMGYVSGQILYSGYHSYSDVIMLHGLRCQGSETRISQCHYPTLSEAGTCSNMRIAKIICFRNSGSVQFHLNMDSTRYNSGRAEILFDGRTMVIEDLGYYSESASVFCRSVQNMNYVTGRVYEHTVTSSDRDLQVLMTNVYCTGTEENILQCPGDFLPTYTSGTRVVYIECSYGAELMQLHNPEGGPSGILFLYNTNHHQSSAVCATNFGENEAGVACRMLGYEHGISHCCMAFGYNYYPIYYKNFKCNGTEQSLYNCNFVPSRADSYRPLCDWQNYVSLTCYNGTKPKNYSISIAGSAPNASSGLVQVTYMNTSGAVCNDGWDDADANVVCRQLKYSHGIAYSHFRSPYGYNENESPYWISNVQCNGTELNIADCPHSEPGNVTSCSGHYAGVLCTRTSDIVFRLVGAERSNYGRVEVQINHIWGSMCNRYWDSRDASVMCRQLGYATGDVLPSDNFSPGIGPVWEVSPRCIGNESRINDCPHEGWSTDDRSYCSSHTIDVGVFCYSSVRLGTGAGKTVNQGPVNVYQNGEWFKVCSDGFSDASARLVCQELGFYDGQAICCSAYNRDDGAHEELHQNITIQCAGDEGDVKDCIKVEQCQSMTYASAICFEASAVLNETEYDFTMRKDFEAAGRIDVVHMGISGRVCSTNWTDVDARVLCKGMQYSDGLAYYHSYEETYQYATELGPYWVSNFSCTGNETDLSECKFNDRLHLGNCSGAHTAAAVCFNDAGIKYRLVSADLSNNYGRIELAIDNRWGTICGQTWDNKDAGVACRYLGFTDGEAEDNNKYGAGTGPVWLRNIQCTGSEKALHACPHNGFQYEEATNEPDYYWYPTCSRHHYDATVFCFKEAKLNQRVGGSTGALLYNHNNKWVHVCDSDSFGHNEAKVACKSLLRNFKDGVAVRGGGFGKAEAPIEIISITCTGNEESLSRCSISTTGSCTSNNYMSLSCFNYTLTSDDFKYAIRLGNDSIRTGDEHGIVEIRENGAWGRVCLNGFTDKEANVTCKELGFNGGVAYLHLFRNPLPMLWSNVSCRGDERSLLNCQHSTIIDPEKCQYLSNDAGVLCYYGEGVKYRLSGGVNGKSGRVEIGIDGVYKAICSSHWDTHSSRVLCRSLGYKDGVVSDFKNSSLANLGHLMSFFSCEGNESSLLTCMNSGFDAGNGNYYHCYEEAYAECFNEEFKITSIRLGDGEKREGRVEVYATGIEQWGTVCDDFWDNLDAQVVCRSLGWLDGVATNSAYNEGQGHIFLDDVECNGTENSISECKHNGINFHNCGHYEDAGVSCFGEPTTIPTTVTSITTRPTSKPTSQTTASSPSVVQSSSTPKATTAKPTTAEATTAEATTAEATTAKPTTAEATTAETTTAETTTPDRSVHDAQLQEEKQKAKVITAAVVTPLVVIIVIVIVGLLLYKFKFKRMSNRHTRFHDDDDTLHNDGSVPISNSAYDNSNVGENPEVRLDHAGYAKFSRGSPSSELQPHVQQGFSNPMFATIMPEQSTYEANA